MKIWRDSFYLPLLSRVCTPSIDYFPPSCFLFFLLNDSPLLVFCFLASICLGSFYIKSRMCVEHVIYLEDDFGTSQLCVYLVGERTPACCTTPKCSQSPLESKTRPKRCHIQSGYTEVCLPKKNMWHFFKPLPWTEGLSELVLLNTARVQLSSNQTLIDIWPWALHVQYIERPTPSGLDLQLGDWQCQRKKLECWIRGKD